MGRKSKRGPGRPSEGARDAIIAAARELFASKGFEATTTDQILQRSGVSKGAIYHHFPSKVHLFEAVYIEVEDESVSRLVKHATGDTPREIIRSGSLGYLIESAGDTDFVKISLTQARRVLGFERWRELAGERGVAVIRALFEAAVEQGEMDEVDPDVAAAIWVAVLIEGGLLVVDSDNKKQARERAGVIFERLLAGLVTVTKA
ncbi:MAG: TetR/AcrR family transcriptional regulator [Solirubrobacterales bacterium]|nr:TetR/AcrR family transcriptional regulator [Solirubrobacterales bacterium]HMT05840.1 TetR/AcrR family transcriptional regulator [Solirubrobacterales bacterium]